MVEATCDGEGAGDARLLLEDGRIILIDKDSAAIPNRWRSANNSAAHPGRLRVLIRGRELWPFDQD